MDLFVIIAIICNAELSCQLSRSKASFDTREKCDVVMPIGVKESFDRFARTKPGTRITKVHGLCLTEKEADEFEKDFLKYVKPVEREKT